MEYFLAAVCLALAFWVGRLLMSNRRLRGLLEENRKMRKSYRAEVLRAQEEKEQERDRMLDALTDSFLLIDGDGRIAFANEAARKLFQGREFRNRPIAEVLLDDRLTSPIREALEGTRQVTRLVSLPQAASPLGPRDRRGENAWLIDAAPVGHGAEASLSRVIIRDMTAEHQADQVRKDFVANASHELRTPLAIINGYIENLLEDSLVDDPETARRFLGVMQKHGDRIARIVEDMLVISRLESGEDAGLKIEPFRFDACVHDVFDRLESMITAQQARVRLKIPEPGIMVVGDRFYWTQILFNLIENALKENPQSPIKVTVGCQRTDEGSLEIYVADSGVGIPSSDLPFIFKRFYRVEKHHSQQTVKGTGLGLSIVKRAVEAHEGDISVASTPGKETRFTMTLPAKAVVFAPAEDDEESAPAATETAPPQAGTPAANQ